MAWMDSEGKLHDDGVFPELKDRAVAKPNAHSVLSEVRDSKKIVHFAGEEFISIGDLEQILNEHFR